MSELTSQQKKKAQNLLDFSQKSSIHPSLPIVEELQAIGETLKSIEAKKMPEMPEFPEPKETDMTETNSLLSRLLERGNEPLEITIEII